MIEWYELDWIINIQIGVNKKSAKYLIWKEEKYCLYEHVIVNLCKKTQIDKFHAVGPSLLKYSITLCHSFAGWLKRHQWNALLSHFYSKWSTVYIPIRTVSSLRLLSVLLTWFQEGIKSQIREQLLVLHLYVLTLKLHSNFSL